MTRNKCFKVSRQFGGKIRGGVGGWFDCIESVIVEAESAEQAITLVEDEKFPNAGTDYTEEYWSETRDLDNLAKGEYLDTCVTLDYEVEVQ